MGGDQGREKARRFAILLTAGIVLTVVASLVTAGLIVRNKPATTAGGKDLQVVEYETPSDPGDDPFTTVADVEGDEVVRFKPAGGTTGGGGGSEPFGGSGSLHVCDREKLVDFLMSHKAQRKAWAGVLKIDDDKDSVSRYVRSLTPVTLTVDTRVTNHSFVNGRAVPFQSILAAGTAVLVDKYGRPVVRCKCGNPLWWPKDYPRISCHHCPPNYHPPKWCKWRTYDPWYGYPPEYLPPEWRDPYPKSYPKPKPWVYKKGDYCYVVYPDPPDVEYPPRWYPPGSTYQPPKYYPKPTYRPQAPPPPDESDESDYTDSSDDMGDMSDHSDDSTGCCGGTDHTDDYSDDHTDRSISDSFDNPDSDMEDHPH